MDLTGRPDLRVPHPTYLKGATLYNVAVHMNGVL